MALERILTEEIQNEMEALRKTELGSDKHKVIVDSVTKLCDRAIELEKFRTEHEFKIEQQAAADDLKSEELRETKKDRWFNRGLTVLGIVVPSGLTVWGLLTTIAFEETGTFTGAMSRGLIQNLIPRKK